MSSHFKNIKTRDRPAITPQRLEAEGGCRAIRWLTETLLYRLEHPGGNGGNGGIACSVSEREDDRIAIIFKEKHLRVTHRSGTSE